MKQFTSCFVGIALPDSYQFGFEQLLGEVREVDPLLDTVFPKTPHITVYYLDLQTNEKLLEISDIVRQYIHLVQGENIEVGGMGLFVPTKPRVMFLNVACSDKLRQFNDA